MTLRQFAAAIACFFALLPALAAVTKLGDYYVATDQTDERLGPSPRAKSTNVLYKRQKVTVLELKDGWARVSRYYDGEVEGVRGSVARWVATSSLSPNVPPEDKVAGSDTALGQALKDSDNLTKYHAAFYKGAQALIASGRCTVQDFKDSGGWSKSTNHPGPVYFAYCGGMRRENRLYLDAVTGRTFQ